jgi:hypothetical protein
VVPPPRCTPRSDVGQTGRVDLPPLTLRLAVAVVAVQALVEALAVSARTELTGALRVVLVLVVGLKLAFAWGARRRSPGAALGLLLAELTTLLAALGATGLGSGARLALGLSAALVIGLVLASLHAFPSPAPPPALPPTGPQPR